MTPKSTAYFLSVKGDLMSKILHEYVFDMQLFKIRNLDGLKSSTSSSTLRAVFDGKNNPFYRRDVLLSFVD